MTNRSGPVKTIQALMATACFSLLALLAFSPTTARAATMDETTGLNPVMLGGSYELDPTKASVKLESYCRAFPSARPLGTVEVKNDVADVKIQSTAYLLAIVSATGEVSCVTDEYHQGGASLIKRPLKAGTYSVFVGDQVNKPSEKPRTASVSFLNNKRGYVFAWEEKVTPVKVAQHLDAVIHIDGSTSAKTGWGKIEGATNDCVGVLLPALPTLVLDVSEAAELNTVLASGADLSLVVLGPLPEGGGKIPSDCFGVASWLPRNLKEGRYIFFVGSETPIDATYSLVVVDEEKTKREPLRMTKDAIIGESVETRAAVRVFPQLRLKADLAFDDAMRASLLEKAPMALFVFPTRNLGEKDVKAGLMSITGHGNPPMSKTKTKLPEFLTPKKDEPLLHLGGGYLLATDGGLFKIERLDLLALKPSASPVFPDQARPLWASYEQAAKLAGPTDKKVVAATARAAEKFRLCTNKVTNLPVKKIMALSKKRKVLQNHRMHTRAENAKIARMTKQIAAIDKAKEKKYQAVCKPDRVSKNKKAARVKLIKSRAKRHQAILTRISKRFASSPAP